MKTVLIPDTNVAAAIKRVTKAFEELKVSYKVANKLSDEIAKDYDMIFVLGGDGSVLRSFHQIAEHSVPLLGVSDSGGEGFLTEIGADQFKSALERIVAGDYVVEDAARLGVVVDGHQLPPALNEVLVVSSKSATLMEYNLSVDDEVVWRDYGDGVIISTPNGSTAYSMSAGGPMILQRTPVFVIVSINSLDVTRRPVVVSEASRIKIGEVSSDYGCVVVVDGTYRIKVKDTVEANKWFTSARLVRLPETSKAMDKMVRKVRLAEDLLKMPPSAKLILKTLEHEGPLTRRDLAKRTMLPDRTARMALALLAQRGLIKRKPLLRDPRHKLYYAS